jgi:hypothetical protein
MDQTQPQNSSVMSKPRVRSRPNGRFYESAAAFRQRCAGHHIPELDNTRLRYTACYSTDGRRSRRCATSGASLTSVKLAVLACSGAAVATALKVCARLLYVHDTLDGVVVRLTGARLWCVPPARASAG